MGTQRARYAVIGTVVVDSGLVMVADPGAAADLVPEDLSTLDGPWNELGPGELTTLDGKVPFSRGVAVPTVAGDGVYPVEARIEKDDEGNEYVTSLSIDLRPTY
jgi:hypothetical protein